MSSKYTNYGRKKMLVLGTAAAAAVSFTNFASAQAGGADSDVLEEIVVTASRRTDTVHNIPMAISAVSSETLEAQGLKTAQDLARTVPALTVAATGAGGMGGATALAPPQVAIRGISSGGSAPTTGIYIDDTPLQQRSLIEAQGGGGLFPNLFDLQRVEVLRGPQGTLYGGSSEGGTIRFITPQPDFDKVNAYVRGELAAIEQGGNNQELGGSISGPIVSDKVAALVTVWRRTDGGYIDHVSRFTNEPIAKDTNYSEHSMMRGILAFKPSDNTKLTLSYLFFNNHNNDADALWKPFPESTTLYPGSDGPHTAYTVPAANFGKYGTGANTNVGDDFYLADSLLSPLLQTHFDQTKLPSLTFDWDMGPVTSKLVGSYMERYNHSNINFAYTDIGGVSCLIFPPPLSLNCGPTTLDFVPNNPVYSAPLSSAGKIKGTTVELRFQSNTPDFPLSWIAGLYYNETKTDTDTHLFANLGDPFYMLSGGIPIFSVDNPNGPVDALGGATPSGPQLGVRNDQHAKDSTYAAFVDATYQIANWRLNAGLRYTKSDFDYVMNQAAPLFGAPVYAQVNNASVSEKPVTPKAGVQYIIDQDKNVYLNASKGYRPGGANAAPTPTCDAAAQTAGLAGVPGTFDSDSLWSYELGSKMRLNDGRATINASLFYIDWKDVQAAVRLPNGNCGFTANAAKVISKGADVEVAAVVFPGFTVTLGAAYTDAKYEGDVAIAGNVFIKDGDEVIGNAKWSGNLSGQYAFDVLGQKSYVRLDYQYQSSRKQSYGAGTTSYSPDAYELSATDYLTARIGMNIDKVDVSLFVDNVLGSTDVLSLASTSGAYGRTGCADATCTSYTTSRPLGVYGTYRPTTYGISASYRY